MEHPEQLKSAILETVVRFDLFDYPLTDFELWRFLPLKTNYEDIKNATVAGLSSADGFLFLAGRENIVKTRQLRYRESLDKINLAKKRLKLISWLPGIKLICLANIIGPNNIKPKADIDLFIITKVGRVWLVKFLATIILKIFNLRPTDKNFTNKLCLSFLIDETALDLKACRHSDQDWYFTYWLAGLIPLVGEVKTYEKLFIANNWLITALPNFSIANFQPLKRFTNKKISDKKTALGNYLEKLSHQLHKNLMNDSLKKNQNQTSNVIINDHVLKLHTIDRRTYLFSLAQKKLAKLIN